MGPAVGILHASGLADLDEVFERLGDALLTLAFADGLASLQFFKLAFDLVRDAVLHLVDMQALRAGRAGRMHGKALRALPRRGDVVLLPRASLAPDSVERPVTDLFGEAVAVAVADMVEDDGAGLSRGEAEGSANLLEVQAEGRSGPQQYRAS